MEKSERIFNASSTLTPDSMMSDESQSRDWILPETVPGCSADASNTADVPQNTLESDVLHQFSNISAEGVECCMHDNSVNKCEISDATESPQLLNRCMLSGIDVSSLSSDVSVLLDSADASVPAELNDARLSLADGDSSVNSTLKASDEDEPTSKHSDATLQPTFSVSIPISTMFETNKDKNAKDVKSPSGRCGSKPVMQVYSCLLYTSDAADE